MQTHLGTAVLAPGGTFSCQYRCQISYMKIKQRLRWSKGKTELKVAEETQNKETHNLLCRQRKRFTKRRSFLNASTANSNGMLVFSDSMCKG